MRFGTMRAQVAGLTAVLADGSTVGSLAGLPKESAGLHLPSLLCGSEGTLGVITAVRLRLVPWFRRTATALVATASLDDAVDLLAALRPLPHLDAVELVLPEAMALVAEHLGTAPPSPDRGRRRLRRGRVRRPRRPDRRAGRGAGGSCARRRRRHGRATA